MAKKIKFPLEMSNGEQVRTLDELKENFDIESVVGYFNDGRLLNWLQARYYDEEADKISALSKDDPQLQKKLCDIFGVESKGEEIDVEEIANRQERLNRLKQYTDDKEILERVDLVAFNQEDLGDLLDEEKPLIYLCHNKFIIPLRETHKTYIGIGKAVAVIRSEEIVDFEELNIKFENVVFDDNYTEILKQQDPKSPTFQPKPSKDEDIPVTEEVEQNSSDFKNDFKLIEDMLDQREFNYGGRLNEWEVVKTFLQKLEESIIKQKNSEAMTKLAKYYDKIHCHEDATLCFKLAKKFKKNIGNKYRDLETYTTTIKNSEDAKFLASLFAHTASKFQSKIQVSVKGRKVDAKSFNIASLDWKKGTEITITANGPDAIEAVKKLGKLVDLGLREYQFQTIEM